MTNQVAKAEKWAVDKLKRMFPAEPNPIVIEVTRVPATAKERAYYRANELEWPSEHKVIPTEIGAIRSDDAALLAEIGLVQKNKVQGRLREKPAFPTIPDPVRAYQEYCELDADAQRDLILRLLNAAAEQQNQAAWDASADLVNRMRLVFKRHGVKHLHFDELRLALDDTDRPKPGKKRSPKRGDQRKALMKTLIILLVQEFDIPISYNKSKKPSQTEVNPDCLCAIVARVCKAHFQDQKFTESAAWTAYYKG